MAPAAARSLPIASTFTHALFRVFDGRAPAQLYGASVNELRALLAEREAEFLREPDEASKRTKVAEFKVAIVMARPECAKGYSLRYSSAS